jgi:tetratricopeptide (TPR) repeat protein
MKKFSVILLAILFSSHLFAQDTAALFEQGNAAYNGGNYALAVEKYEAILTQEQHSAELYFNLGNTHYRLGNVAESVYYFEQAKRLQPADKTIRNNAAFANNMTLDAIEELPETQLETLQQGILVRFSLDQWAKITLFLAWLSFVLFVLYRFNQPIQLKRIFFVLGCVVLLLTLSSLSLSQAKLSEDSLKKAIVYNAEIEIWAEPNKRSDILFLLHEGTSLNVLSQLEGWSKIKLANGSEGWIQNNAIKTLH